MLDPTNDAQLTATPAAWLHLLQRAPASNFLPPKQLFTAGSTTQAIYSLLGVLFKFHIQTAQLLQRSSVFCALLKLSITNLQLFQAV